MVSMLSSRSLTQLASPMYPSPLVRIGPAESVLYSGSKITVAPETAGYTGDIRTFPSANSTDSESLKPALFAPVLGGGLLFVVIRPAGTGMYVQVSFNGL